MRNEAQEKSLTRTIVLLTADGLSTKQISDKIDKSQSFVYRIQKTPMFESAFTELLDSKDKHYAASMLSAQLGDPTRFHARNVLAPKALEVVGDKLDSLDEKIQLQAVGAAMDIARHGVQPTRAGGGGVTVNNNAQQANFSLNLSQEQTSAILDAAEATERARKEYSTNA